VSWWQAGSISASMAPPRSARWFVCRGCGIVAGYFPEGMADIPPGSVVHLKPTGDINRRTVACVLYQRLEPDQFWALHQDDPPAEPPLQMQPISPGIDDA
jgi:hypothetical protein